MILSAILWAMCFVEVSFFLPLSLAAPSDHHSQCASGHFYIDDHRQPGCYPIVQLEEACDFDVQCNAAVAYSFCRWEDEQHSSRPKCTCFDGFAPTLDGRCHPVDRCHLNSFNARMLQADCSKENQFCRYGHCLCKPGYAYEAATEECLPLPRKKNLTNDGRLGGFVLVNDAQLEDESDISTADELKRMKFTLRKLQFFISLIMFVLIITLLGSLGMLIYMKKHYFMQKMEAKTGNPKANIKEMRKALNENTLIPAENGTMERLKDHLTPAYFDRT